MDILSRIFSRLYVPRVNILMTVKTMNINVNIFIYLILFLSILYVKAFELLIFRKERKQNVRPYLSMVLATCFCIFFLVNILQMGPLVKFFKKDIRLFSGKPLHEKHMKITHGFTSVYARMSKEVLPGFHSAAFVSDIDIHKSPGMLIHRMLAYYLYPIDMRQMRKEPIDCMVLFHKKNAEEYIPDDFEILRVLDNKNIIAIKKEILAP